jgi:hypothetical protein
MSANKNTWLVRRFCLGVLVLASAANGGGTNAPGLALIDKMLPGRGALAGCGFDPATERIWAYAAKSDDLRSYAKDGRLVGSVPRPGERADDVDIDIAPEPLALGSTPVPSGTVLFIDGENGPAEIHAVNASNGAVIATLHTGFGVSHVVGGAYHPGRDTLFLVQDSVPTAGERNRIAEIDPTNGKVLNSFSIEPFFAVSWGDIEVDACSGHLFVVSSVESRIAEFTPKGEWVGYLKLPDGVSELSGIGMDEARGEMWVSGKGGIVWHLGGLPARAPHDRTSSTSPR